MPSPTELSSTILDALIERYSSDVEAEVFTDEEGEQLLALKFADRDRYTLRIETKEALADDPAQNRDFSDERTGAHARITSDKLMIFTEPATTTAANPERGRPYMLYPLHKIYWVSSIEMPGGQTAVYMAVTGEDQGPGLTFVDPQTAASFEQALKGAIGQP